MEVLQILEDRFGGADGVEGRQRPAPIGVARLELFDDGVAEIEDDRMLRRRDVSELIELFVKGVRAE